MDVLMLIHHALLEDEYIESQTSYSESGKTKYRIKFYEYPETGNVDGAYIVIDPLDAPLPSVFGDNTYLTEDYIFQVDVWTKNRLVTKKISKRVQDVLWKLNFPVSGGGMDEYDKPTGIYRMAKRYRGKVNTEEFEDA